MGQRTSANAPVTPPRAAAPRSRPLLPSSLPVPPEPSIVVYPQNHSAFARAVRSGQLALAAQLADEYEFDLNGRDQYGDPPLHIAAYKGDAEMIQFLVRRGGHLEATDMHLCTPLHRAILHRQAAAVRALVSLGADVDAQTPSGYSAFHLALLTREKSIIRVLYAAYPNINTIAEFRRSPLHAAAMHNDCNLLDCMLRGVIAEPVPPPPKTATGGRQLPAGPTDTLEEARGARETLSSRKDSHVAAFLPRAGTSWVPRPVLRQHRSMPRVVATTDDALQPIVDGAWMPATYCSAPATAMSPTDEVLPGDDDGVAAPHQPPTTAPAAPDGPQQWEDRMWEARLSAVAPVTIVVPRCADAPASSSPSRMTTAAAQNGAHHAPSREGIARPGFRRMWHCRLVDVGVLPTHVYGLDGHRRIGVGGAVRGGTAAADRYDGEGASIGVPGGGVTPVGLAAMAFENGELTNANNVEELLLFRLNKLLEETLA